VIRTFVLRLLGWFLMLQSLISLLGPGAQALKMEVKDDQELEAIAEPPSTLQTPPLSKVTPNPTLFY
jgi:hypothetical protein